MTTAPHDIPGLRQRLRKELTAYWSRPHSTGVHQAAARQILLSIFKDSRRGVADGWELLNAVGKGDPKAKVNPTTLKGALRDQLAPLQSHRCCYCRRWMPNNGHARHIEHILPHAKFPQFSFHFWNLALACSDCNLLKRDTIWGGIDTKRRRYPLPGKISTWFHPRFHDYDEHVRFVRLESNGTAVVIFVGLTEAGRFVCDNLLRDIAKMEMLVASNPVLRGYAATLQDYQTNRTSAQSAPKGEALRQFQGQLARSVVNLVKQP